MSLRDEIADIIWYNDNEILSSHETDADAILALVRDRLTSDEVVKAAHKAYWPTPNFFPEGTMQDAITVALDAALGEGH